MPFVQKLVLPYQTRKFGFGEDAAMLILVAAALIQIACTFASSGCLLTGKAPSAVVQHR